MAENLNYDVPSVTTDVCFQNNCDTYGRVYDFNTASAACPVGWHLPSGVEWQTLIDFVDGGDAEPAGIKLMLKGAWGSADGIEMDKFFFSALPGGYTNSRGVFSGVGVSVWWMTSENTKFVVITDDGNVNFRESANRGYVRCLQD
jgi:uncharacterized protein (TIGR02145 family)